MLSLKPRFVRLSASVLVTSAIALGAAIPAFAGDDIVQTLNGGSLSTGLTNLSLAQANYAHADQNADGTMTLNADDKTGTGEGWNVTLVASNFVYTGDYSGTNIPAANFSLTSAATPVKTAGQVVDATHGPKVPSISPLTTLETARKVIQAEADYGQGTYTQALGVRLVIPGMSRAGTYSGTLTTSITAAP
jgi:hypothetical protein